ncbi:MAG TPA: hypothetical protein VG602_03055 [Actinomycetota bacterium]|nr:hypothetical protein [Actinomycetota bacterium]
MSERVGDVLRDKGIADQGRDSVGFLLGCAIAALTLGRAIQVAEGHFAPEAIAWLAVSLLVLGVAVLFPGPVERFGDRPLWVILGVGLAAQFAQLVTTVPAIYLTEATAAELDAFGWVMAGTAIVSLGAIFGARSLARILFPLLIVIYLLAGVWIIRSSPDPPIDVHVVHQDSIDALVAGRNPYEITFPNIYGHERFYGPGMVQDGRVQFGFQYPPLSLLLSAPGKLVAGDFRYAHLVAGAIAGALIAGARPGRVATAAATLFLFTPRTFFIIEQGWTEPLMLMLLAAVSFAAVRRWAFSPYMAGALVASKQYAVWFLPLVVLLRRTTSMREAVKELARALGVALAVTLPFFLWGPRAFLYDLFTVQARLPFREEGLTFLSLWSRLTGDVPPSWIGWLIAAGAVALVLLRAPRTASGFGAGGALVLALFFAFNRSAFANYYYFVLGSLWIAVAAGSVASPRARSQSGLRLDQAT